MFSILGQADWWKQAEQMSQEVSWPQRLNMDALATQIKLAGSAVRPQL